MYQKRLHSLSFSRLLRTFNSHFLFLLLLFLSSLFSFLSFLVSLIISCRGFGALFAQRCLGVPSLQGKGACLREFPETLQLQKSSVAQSKYRNLASKIRRYFHRILRCQQLVSFMQFYVAMFVHIIISSSVVQPQCMVRYMVVNLGP